jgi:hypothetical protein
MKFKKLNSNVSNSLDIDQPKRDSSQSMDNLSAIPSEFQCEYGLDNISNLEELKIEDV